MLFNDAVLLNNDSALFGVRVFDLFKQCTAYSQNLEPIAGGLVLHQNQNELFAVIGVQPNCIVGKLYL